MSALQRAALDPDRLAAACIAGRRKYDAVIAPRDTIYSPSEALYTAIEWAISTYLESGYKASPEKAAEEATEGRSIVENDAIQREWRA